MTPPATPVFSDLTTAVCILFVFLVPLAAAGIALINTGLGRSRSAAHSMMTSLAVFAVAAVVFFICGFAFQGYAGGPAHVLRIAGKDWGWIGAQQFFLRGLRFDGSASSLVAWLQMLSVGLAAMIPLGSGGDRWKLSACCASSALLAGITYPIFAHWVWGGGWLAQLGANYGLGRGFVDAGGSGNNPGCRRIDGAFDRVDSRPAARQIRGGRNASGDSRSQRRVGPVRLPAVAARLVRIELRPARFFSRMWIRNAVVLIAINTTLCAAAATLATALVTRIRLASPTPPFVRMAGLAAWLRAAPPRPFSRQPRRY